MNRSTSTFSWQRTAIVAGYYLPSLRLQLILYPALSAAVGIINYFMFNTSVWGLFGGMMTLALQFMLYLAPIAFTRKSSQAIETILPATWTEKAIFIITYSLVVVPLLVYIPKFACTQLLNLFFDSDIAAFPFSNLSSFRNFAVNLVQDIVPTATCLFVVMNRTTNRALLGSVWAIVSLVIIGITGAIIGIIIIYDSGIIQTVTNGNTLDETDVTNAILSTSTPYINIISIICLLYIIGMICLTAQKLKKIQI